MRRKLCCGDLRARTNIARMSEGSGTPPPGQPAGGKRPAIGLQIKLPCASLDDVKARYAEELRQNRFFVRTRTPRPKDTLVRLEAQPRRHTTRPDGPNLALRGATRPPPKGPPPAPAPGAVPPAKAAIQDATIRIHLRTTNPAAAAVRDGKPFVIPSREGSNTIPS